MLQFFTESRKLIWDMHTRVQKNAVAVYIPCMFKLQKPCMTGYSQRASLSRGQSEGFIFKYKNEVCSVYAHFLNFCVHFQVVHALQTINSFAHCCPQHGSAHMVGSRWKRNLSYKLHLQVLLVVTGTFSYFAAIIILLFWFNLKSNSSLSWG